jgi:hypothetical protein
MWCPVSKIRVRRSCSRSAARPGRQLISSRAGTPLFFGLRLSLVRAPRDARRWSPGSMVGGYPASSQGGR